jgi:hypothetical protein
VPQTVHEIVRRWLRSIEIWGADESSFDFCEGREEREDIIGVQGREKQDKS